MAKTKANGITIAQFARHSGMDTAFPTGDFAGPLRNVADEL